MKYPRYCTTEQGRAAYCKLVAYIVRRWPQWQQRVRMKNPDTFSVFPEAKLKEVRLEDCTYDRRYTPPHRRVMVHAVISRLRDGSAEFWVELTPHTKTMEKLFQQVWPFWVYKEGPILHIAPSETYHELAALLAA